MYIFPLKAYSRVILEALCLYSLFTCWLQLNWFYVVHCVYSFQSPHVFSSLSVSLTLFPLAFQYICLCTLSFLILSHTDKSGAILKDSEL